METKTIKTDYLIVGSGAVGMAFADILLHETDANITIVDRYHRPGGHWNVAYPFVTLHQPSAFYGVSSRELSNGRIDQVGLNQGMHDLATGAEISAYYEAVMHEQFLPTGRVQYFPMCNYLGDGRFQSITTGQTYETEVAIKTVDCTYLNTTVPSTHTPKFGIEEGVWFMPPNDLAKLKKPPRRYVVIGGGKTGIDTCIWLLQNNVDPEDIQWIMPRDAWLIDRKNTQPGIQFFHDSMGAQADQMEAIAQSTSVDDLFDRLEKAGILLRIDTNIKPSMFHAATISQAELAELRRIKHIIRHGRVTKAGRNQLTLEHGVLPTGPDVLHVDCSASAITNAEMKPVFEGDLITPQTVRSYQPVFSAAFIAHVEANYDDEAEKNRLCTVVPLPNHDTDWIKMMVPFMMNQFNWSQDKGLRQWLNENRLDGFAKMVRSIDKDDTEKQAVIQRMRNAAMPAMAKLQKYVAELET